jgi:hypothetical protein
MRCLSDRMRGLPSKAYARTPDRQPCWAGPGMLAMRAIEVGAAAPIVGSIIPFETNNRRPSYHRRIP